MAKMFFARCKIKASFVFHSLMNIFEISNTPTRRCYINHNKDYSVVKTFKVERKLRLFYILIISFQFFRFSRSQTNLDFAHLRVIFRRWRGITFAKGYSANFAAYNGNIKEKPALCEQQSLLAANEEKEWVIFSYEKNI